MYEKIKQRDQIVAYLKTHSAATVRDLFALNINSPTKRISELVKAGYPIEKEWKVRINRAGETKRFMVYRWKETGQYEGF